MAGEMIMVGAGETLVEEGTLGTQMFVVERGRVEVSRRRGDVRVVLATLGPGAIIGELALLESLPRSATVTAVEDTAVFPVDSAALLQRIAADPMFALRLLQTMSARIRRLTHELFSLAIETHARDEEQVRDRLAEIEYTPPGYL